MAKLFKHSKSVLSPRSEPAIRLARIRQVLGHDTMTLPRSERSGKMYKHEEERLQLAARDHDDQYSFNLAALDHCVEEIRQAFSIQNDSDRRTALVEAVEVGRRRARGKGFKHIHRLETLIRFMLMTGIRQGDALALRWEQLDRGEELVELDNFKWNRPNPIHIPEEIRNDLETLPRNGPLVFDMEPDELYDAWKKICATAGLMDLKFSNLRLQAFHRANGWKC